MLPTKSSTNSSRAVASLVLLAGATGCRDLSSFNTDGGSYQGQVANASFILAGVGGGVSLCLTMDTSQLQTSPGTISTNDGRFHDVPLRSAPQLWTDPLSSLSFGEGRLRNLIYVATPNSTGASVASDAGNDSAEDAGSEDAGAVGVELGDVTVVLSLMQSGAIEARLMRGAPPLPGNDAGAVSILGPPVFAVFSLMRSVTPCSY